MQFPWNNQIEKWGCVFSGIPVMYKLRQTNSLHNGTHSYLKSSILSDKKSIGVSVYYIYLNHCYDVSLFNKS